MDITLAFPLCLSLTCAVLGYFIKRLISSLDTLRNDFESESRRNADQLAAIRDSYLKHAEFVRFQTAIDQKLNKIYDILVR